jgi:hypothetical protein
MSALPGEDVLKGLAPEARARIDALVSKGWSPPGEHPLARLHGTPLGDHRLLALLGPKNNVGSRYFQLFLADGEGQLGDGSLALGLYNSGQFPAYNWVELTQYRPMQRFAGRVLDLAAEGLDRRLFEMLLALVPPGGHLMIEYDSPGQKATERILTLGYPPATSPLGYLMFTSGCRSYRDWYISEGGREGPRKLQCFKPLNEDIRSEKEEKLRGELEAFLARSEDPVRDEWTELARRLARAVLAALEGPHTNP